MSHARVLASPGVPHALDAFLPGGRRPDRLAWPLPEGSLLVLGLPSSDTAARQLCDVFQLDVDDLRGGYRIWAWHAAARSLVFLMGADAAALQAARFEFDASAPREMMDPSMRSLDFGQPNQEAAVVVRAGTRRVTPRFAARAWFPGDAPHAGDALLAAGANADRLWIDVPPEAEAAAMIRHIRALRAQGILPVLTLRTALPPTSRGREAWLDRTLGPLLRWQARAALRDFAVRFEEEARGRTPSEPDEAWCVRGMLERLRPGGLDTLIVVPRAHSDRLARTLGPPPDLRGLPEVAVAWSGPQEHSLHITRAQAERRVREAGVPVVLLETWSDGARAAAAIPTLPSGRAPDLGDVLAGIIVVGRPGADSILEAAWQPAGAPRFGMAELAPLLPGDEKRPAPFLQRLATSLERAAKESLGLIPWMAPLAAEVRAGARRVAAADGVLMLSASGSPGALQEPGPVEAIARCDGRALRVGIRIGREPDEKVPDWSLQLQLEAPGRTARWRVDVTAQAQDISMRSEPARLRVEPGHVTCTRGEGDAPTSFDIVFDRFALGGEPHPGRTFTYTLTFAQRAAVSKTAGTIVIGK